MNKMPMRITPDEIQTLAQATEGYSGADLENLCREAALICLRQDITNTEVTSSCVPKKNKSPRSLKPTSIFFHADASSCHACFVVAIIFADLIASTLFFGPCCFLYCVDYFGAFGSGQACVEAFSAGI